MTLLHAIKNGKQVVVPTRETRSDEGQTKRKVSVKQYDSAGALVKAHYEWRDELSHA